MIQARTVATIALLACAGLSAAPAPPAGPAAAPAGAGGGAQAAQGLQIINAVNSVLTAQNNLIIQWVAYEAFRLDMYNFMGTLEVDPEGYWTDEFYQERARVHRANPNRLYPPLPGSSGGYGPVDGELPDVGTYARSSPPEVVSPPPDQLQVGVERKTPAGRIKLVSGESPEALRASIPPPAARRPARPAKKSENASAKLNERKPGSGGTDSAGDSEPGHARVAR
jgi:hypothetical protein